MSPTSLLFGLSRTQLPANLVGATPAAPIQKITADKQLAARTRLVIITEFPITQFPNSPNLRRTQVGNHRSYCWLPFAPAPAALAESGAEGTTGNRMREAWAASW